MTCYNLPPLMVEHQSCVYHSNSILVNLVNIIAVDYRSRYWLLNPLVLPCKQNKKERNNKNNETRGNTSNTTTASEEQISLGRAFTRNARRRNSKLILNLNPFNILAELDDDEENYNVEEMVQKIQNDKEVKRFKDRRTI